MLNLYQVALAGFVQGILEWLPVSSSGQVMVFLSSILGLRLIEAYRLALYLHMGTLFSAILYYREDIIDSIKSYGISFNNSLLRLWVITTIVSVVTGYPIYIVYQKILGNVSLDIATSIIGLSLIITGLLLMYAKSKKNYRTFKDLGVKDYIVLGIAQGISIIPGISRSGITIAILLLLGLHSSDAVKTSFLASIPIIALASIYIGLFQGYIVSIVGLIGMLSALGAGLIGLWVMVFMSKKLSLYYFALTIGLIMVLATIPFII